MHNWCCYVPKCTFWLAFFAFGCCSELLQEQEKFGTRSSTRPRWFTRAPVLIHTGTRVDSLCWQKKCVSRHISTRVVLIPCIGKITCFLGTFPHGQCWFTRAPVLNLLCWFLNFVFCACCYVRDWSCFDVQCLICFEYAVYWFPSVDWCLYRITFVCYDTNTT